MSVAIPAITTQEEMTCIKKKLLSYKYTMPVILERLEIEEYRMWKSIAEIFARVNNFLARDPADDFDLLIRTFLLNAPVSRQRLGKIFSESELKSLTDMHMLALTGPDRISCDLAVAECEGLLIAADSLLKQFPGINPVMPLFPESYELASARTHKHVEKTLDLCTGSGIHALLASRHSERVVGVDINPRAVAFAKFNAALNQIHNVEFVEGDLFAAVEEEEFDLILANPPYMPVTDSRPGDNFYCGGKQGNALSSRIIRGLPRYLRKNGLCQMIHMMICNEGESHETILRSLLGDKADRHSFIVLSNPIDFRNENIANTASVEFGVTNIMRHEDQYTSFLCQAPFVPPLPFDIDDLFTALTRVSNDEEREHVCRAFYE